MGRSQIYPLGHLCNIQKKIIKLPLRTKTSGKYEGQGLKTSLNFSKFKAGSADISRLTAFDIYLEMHFDEDSLDLYICIYLLSYIYIYIYVCVCVCVCVCECVCMYIIYLFMCVCVYIYIYIYIYICKHACRCVCVSVCIYIYIYICVCVCVSVCTVADWPSGAPGVFPLGRCTMWVGSLRNIYIKKMDCSKCTYILPSALTNGPGHAAHFIQKF